MTLEPNDSTAWFTREVHAHEPELRRYLVKLVPGCDIDDLVQETYIRLLKHRETHEIVSPRGILFAISRNVARDRYRRQATSKTTAVPDFDDLHVLDTSMNIPDSLCLRQETEVLEAAIESLPARCRTVFVMRKIHNLSHQEIADRLGISIFTVRAHLAKGMELCERYLRMRGIIPSPKNETD